LLLIINESESEGVPLNEVEDAGFDRKSLLLQLLNELLENENRILPI